MSQETFFGLLSRPFQASPRHECFVALEPMVDAVEQLVEAALKGDGVGVLTATPGAGKTVVCLQVQKQLESTYATVLLRDCSFPTRRSLLQSILHALGHEYAGLSEQEARLALIDAAESIQQEREGLVIIADEAHQLGPRLLEELRCLTNHVHRGRPLVRVLLSGQLSLEEQLTKPELQSLNYRITCHISLEPLSMQQSAQYVDERLTCVGSDAGSLFDDDALEMICRVSDGNPRCLNQIADACLTHAAEAGQGRIDAPLIRQVLRELKQLPLQWNESTCDQVDDGTDSSLETWDEEPDEENIELANDEHFVTSVASPGDPEQGGAVKHSEEPAWMSRVTTIEIGADTNLPADATPSHGQTANAGTSECGAADRDHEGCEADLQTATAEPELRTQNPLVSSAKPVPDRSKGGELREIAVDDRYAALDRNSPAATRLDSIAAFETAIAWTEQTAHFVRLAPVETESACSSARTDTHQVETLENVSPEENIDRMIEAVTEAVALEISRDHSIRSAGIARRSDAATCHLQSQISPWRATPDPAAYDVIEPDWGSIEADVELAVMPAGGEEATSLQDQEEPATATADEMLMESHGLQPPPAGAASDAPERPYARLFSRARRSRTRV